MPMREQEQKQKAQCDDSVTLSFVCPKVVAMDIADLAKSQGVTNSDIIRRALFRLVAAEKRKSDRRLSAYFERKQNQNKERKNNAKWRQRDKEPRG